MPHTDNRKIVSCAGDNLIKLSEVEYTPERQAPGSTKRTWYCHTDMAKRIVTEDNPNTFLSCSEDGTFISESFLTEGDIRHHDLRSSHPCTSSQRRCPAPLISYKPYHIELTTLTMTKANPIYLIIGGSHPHAFLHDRRMIGRDLKNEWGNVSWNSDTPTQVVFFPGSMLIPVCPSILSKRNTTNKTTECSYHSL
jgi:DDB1- and CUL4-associated factor 6